MHFCQSQFVSFLPEDNSCILESDLDPLGGRMIKALLFSVFASCRLCAYNPTKICTKVDAIGASATEANGLQARGEEIVSFSLVRASYSLCFLCNPCHPLFLNPWPPFVAPFDLPLLLSSLCPLSGRENKVGLFVQLVPTSLIL